MIRESYDSLGNMSSTFFRIETAVQEYTRPCLMLNPPSSTVEDSQNGQQQQQLSSSGLLHRNRSGPESPVVSCAILDTGAEDGLFLAARKVRHASACPGICGGRRIDGGRARSLGYGQQSVLPPQGYSTAT